MKSLVARILASAAVEMWQDKSLNLYAIKTGEHELNLKVHYIHPLVNWFPWLEWDTDVIKRAYGDKRPDVIFHKRGIHDQNFLIVEVKRERDAEGVTDDLEKIRNNWFSEPLKYRFGASVLLKESNRGFVVRIISNDQPYNEELLTDADSFQLVPMPQLNREQRSEWLGLTAKVVDGMETQHNLDLAVFKFYNPAN